MSTLLSVHDLAARSSVQALVASQIREVANEGLGDPAILAFWFGEPDEVTPAYIRDAAVAALAAGETFYTQNYGIPELRQAIAAYVTRLHRPVPESRIAVTASGMSALMLAIEALIDPGDRVVCVTPLWPNLTEIPKILGATVARVPLSFGRDGWTLDLDRLLAALTPETRAVMINSPNNPSGWTIDRESQRTILEHCRERGIWIVADDVYERLFYASGACAPSFLDIATADDRLVSTNSFSKAWLMTGWRLGSIVAPTALMRDLGKLIEYNTSCSPAFVQRAGVVALERGESTVARLRSSHRGLLHLCARMRRRDDHAERQSTTAESKPAPAGAMYAFFKVDGVADSLEFCKRLVRDAKLGLAPGSAFGPEGEGFVRWCFAASEERLAEGIARLSAFMNKR